MVSHTPVPEPAAEITIDLDGEAEPERTPPRRRIPNAALAFAAALVMFAAAGVAAVKWLPDREPAAEEAVRSFLEAVRAGDVDAALAWAGETSGSEQFLVPEALDGRWDIVEVAQVAYDEEPREAISGDEPDATAEVYAEIEAYDGTRLGYRYEVSLGEGGPVIADALGHASYDVSGFRELELNGYTADLGYETHVLLFPGLYELDESQPVTLDLGLYPVLALGDQFIALGGDYASHWLPAAWPQVSATGQEVLDAAVREHLDRCASSAHVEGCPFAPPPGDDRIAIPDDASWEITAYPKVNARYTYTTGDVERSFALFTLQPGSVEVEAVVTEADGDERRTTLSCGIWMDGAYADFDADGGVTLTRGSEADRACRAMLEVE